MFFFFFEENINKNLECDSLKSFLECLDELPKNIYNYNNNKNHIKNELNDSMELYKKAVIDSNLKNNDFRITTKYFYRGQYNIKYNLLPSVFRLNHYRKEDFYYHQIKVECPNDFDENKKLDQLVKMQHYDCPTRLLDITSNPLVALYFACKNFGCEKCKAECDGVVYVIPAEINDILYSDSDKALMLATLAKFSKDQKGKLYDECMSNLSPLTKIKHPRMSVVMKKFEHEVKTEKPSFTLDLNPLDLLRCFIVQPEKLNQRILKQDGAFIISGLSKDEKEATRKLESMVFKKIIVKNKESILDELDKIGINEATLFPEVDKVANYLKMKNI